ncbi:MAG: aminotransferase class IV [Finegoldia sp.]|nr:aminotransferase class IV [Finegoldia sp.]
MSSEGLKFGFGAFETIKVLGGRPIYYEEHLERFINTLNFLGLNTENIKEKIKVEVSKLDLNKDNVLRIMGYKDEDDLKIEAETRTSSYDDKKYHDGLKLKVLKPIRDKNNPLTRHKTNNYLLNKICLDRVREDGYDEGVFLNQEGNFTEGTYTNIFFLKKDIVITPRIEDGLLPGIYRQVLIKKLRACGIACEERSVHISELEDMEAMLVTNSLMQARFVKSLSGKDFVKNDLCEKIISFNL